MYGIVAYFEHTMMLTRHTTALFTNDSNLTIHQLHPISILAFLPLPSGSPGRFRTRNMSRAVIHRTVASEGGHGRARAAENVPVVGMHGGPQPTSTIRSAVAADVGFEAPRTDRKG